MPCSTQSTPNQKDLGKFRLHRHFVQTAVLLFFIIAPCRLSGVPGFEEGIIKFDLDLWRIHFFGLTLVQGLFHICFLFLLLPFFGLIISSSLYNKVFCGWVCPQNIFFEMFESVQKNLKKHHPSYRRSPRLQAGVEFLLSCGWGLLIAWTAVSYFKGASPIFSTGLFLFVLLFFVYDTFSLKHRFCQMACPYALLQKSMGGQTALHVAWEDRPGNPCGRCRACETACYVQINVRKDPFHIDCTMCGACVDACTGVFRNKPEPPLLRFAFEDEVRGEPYRPFGINSWPKFFLITLFGLYCLMLVGLIFFRPQYDFRVDYPMSGGSHQTVYQKEGLPTNAFTIKIRNLTSKEQAYLVKIEEDDFTLYSAQGAFWTVPPLSQIRVPVEVSYKKAENIESGYFPIHFQLYGGTPAPTELLTTHELQVYIKNLPAKN